MNSIPRGRAIWIIVLGLLPLGMIAILLGSPRGWFLIIFAFVTAPFTLVLRDRPAVFAGILSAILAAGLWWVGTTPLECSVSIDDGRVGLPTIICHRMLLPDLGHVPTWIDTMIANAGMWPVGMGVGGAAATIVDRRMRIKHPLVPPPPPSGGEEG